MIVTLVRMLGLIGISTKYVSILDCRIKVVFYEISSSL